MAVSKKTNDDLAWGIPGMHNIRPDIVKVK